MPPITIQAGNSRRLIAVLNATDKDEDDRIRYMDCNGDDTSDDDWDYDDSIVMMMLK